MRQAFKERRDFACERFNTIKGLKASKPDGAFYLFVHCAEISKDSMQFCKNLLEYAGVAVVPGIGFGMDGYFRFSFATDLNSIDKGIQRIKDYCENL